MFSLQQQMEGQPAAGELAGQETVLQEICALHIRGWRDSLVGLEVLKEATCLWSEWNVKRMTFIQFYFSCIFICYDICYPFGPGFFFYLADRKTGPVIISSLHDLQNHLNSLIVVRTELYGRNKKVPVLVHTFLKSGTSWSSEALIGQETGCRLNQSCSLNLSGNCAPHEKSPFRH